MPPSGSYFGGPFKRVNGTVVSPDPIIAPSVNGLSLLPDGSAIVDRPVAESDLSDLVVRNGITLYDVEAYGTGREIALHVYPEGLANYDATKLAKLERLRVKGGSRLSLKPASANTSNKQTRVISVPLTSRNMAPFSSVDINVVRTKFAAAKTANKPFFPLIIGDSISATEFLAQDGTKDGGWNLASIIKEYAVLDAIDGNSSFPTIPVGTLGNLSGANFNTGTVAYKGSARALRAFSEGRGGWCAATYLRHPVLLTGTTGASDANHANGPASWQFLGLETANGAYVNDYAHNSLIRVTRSGANAYNYGSDLWLFLQQRPEWTGPAAGTGWTDTAPNRGFIDAAMTAIFVNPDNPFWSNNAASFNIYQWSGRYKTINSSGARLVVGSTAGSRITAENLNNIDVYEYPTHIIIELGENDRWQFPENPTQTISDLTAIRDAIAGQLAWMGANAPPIAFVFTRTPGAFSPYADPSTVRQAITGNAIYKQNLQALAQAAGLLVLDVQATQDTDAAYWSADRYVMDTRGRNKLPASGYDSVHPGLSALRGIAYQIYAWMLSTVVS